MIKELVTDEAILSQPCEPATCLLYTSNENNCHTLL